MMMKTSPRPEPASRFTELPRDRFRRPSSLGVRDDVKYLASFTPVSQWPGKNVKGTTPGLVPWKKPVNAPVSENVTKPPSSDTAGGVTGFAQNGSSGAHPIMVTPGLGW